MKNKKLFAIIVILFCLIILLQGCGQRFTLSGESIGNIGGSAGNWMKENIFMWYTTDTTGSLKPEYATPRKAVDFILFFTLFFSLSLLGLKQVFKEGGNAVNALAFAIGFLLALSLVSFTQATLAIFFPFAKNIIFLVMLWVIFALLKKILGDKHKVLIFIAALIITWLAFNYLGPGLGVSNMALPRQDYTAGISELQTKIELLESKPGLTPAEEKELISMKNQLSDRLVSQGLTELERRNYDAAEKNFRDALLANPSNKKAKSWREDGLFNRMLKENIELLRISRSILDSMNKEYKETKDPELCTKMAQLLTEIKNTKDKLDEEINKRLVNIEREREKWGIVECQKNYECKDFKEGYVCIDNKCVQCTQQPDLCGSGKVCDAVTGKCKPEPKKTTSGGGGSTPVKKSIFNPGTWFK
jgi:tetratricopeptide (TPR) repeat protein